MTRRDARLLAFLALTTALLFLHPFLLGRTHYVGDVTYSFQPWLTYAAQQIQAGHFPLWNPYTSCGEPFFANPQNMLMFPGAVWFWLFDFATAWRLSLVTNQSLLTLAFYLLAGRWSPASSRGARALAALAFAWGGFTVVHWEFPAVAATLPHLLLFFFLSLAGPAWGDLPPQDWRRASAGWPGGASQPWRGSLWPRPRSSRLGRPPGDHSARGSAERPGISSWARRTS